MSPEPVASTLLSTGSGRLSEVEAFASTAVGVVRYLTMTICHPEPVEGRLSEVEAAPPLRSAWFDTSP